MATTAKAKKSTPRKTTTTKKPATKKAPTAKLKAVKPATRKVAAKAPVKSKVSKPKAKAPDTTTPMIIELGSLALALMFAYSVLQIARNIADMDTKTFPSTYALTFALLLAAYAWYLRNKKVSYVNGLALGVVAVSGLWWLLGISL